MVFVLTIYEFDNDENAIDIGVWENEGGALHRFSMHHHYGRRIEPNRSWTVYHVYTGLPADMGKHSTTGLNETTATAMMISLNANNAERRRAARIKRKLIDTPPVSLP
ncbi:hypothetical protein CU102_04065 [Phyllobacterium brassicacearum]|uniref:Uncharacterized protein n=1 Tax=Phyllobacterium brassicacearum TaxID=314235 RepID=A0A2P7BUX0_9HYPH|nr:hypothetical protein CU102_04065 [Phyllobacterium brassicacearum]TDQ33839.1 hypothetical protein DEV91_10440 [Phyllobacterium brassicacearum]